MDLLTPTPSSLASPDRNPSIRPTRRERDEQIPVAHARRKPVLMPLGLALLGSGLVGFGLLKRKAVGTVATVAGLGLSAAAYWRLRRRVAQPLEVFRAVTVEASPEELFVRWMDLSNLPMFMRHLERVEVLSPTRSRWTARATGKLPKVTWDAEIVEARENQLVHWRSLPGSLAYHEGTVSFVPAPGERGTEVHARILYRPPGGTFGRAAAAAVQQVIAQEIQEDLRRFKRLLETGELPSIEGQPHGQPNS